MSPVNIPGDLEACPHCGKRFHCSKSGKCWCFEVAVSPEILEEIGKKYDHCLCPSCLKELSEMAPEENSIH